MSKMKAYPELAAEYPMKTQDKFDAEYSQLLARFPDLHTFTLKDQVVIMFREGRMDGMDEVFSALALAHIIPQSTDARQETQAWDEAYTPSVIVRDA